MPRNRVCVVCGGLYRAGGFYTCSGECHERLVDALGRSLASLRRSLWREDLRKYPKWRAGDDCIEVPGIRA